MVIKEHKEFNIFDGEYCIDIVDDSLFRRYSKLIESTTDSICFRYSYVISENCEDIITISTLIDHLKDAINYEQHLLLFNTLYENREYAFDTFIRYYPKLNRLLKYLERIPNKSHVVAIAYPKNFKK